MGFFNKILDFFKSNKKRDKDKELQLFDLSKYDRPGYLNYKRCPRCSLEVSTNQEVQDLFGVMHVKGHVHIQSWCRKCRMIKKKESSSIK